MYKLTPGEALLSFSEPAALFFAQRARALHFLREAARIRFVQYLNVRSEPPAHDAASFLASYSS